MLLHRTGWLMTGRNLWQSYKKVLPCQTKSPIQTDRTLLEMLLWAGGPLLPAEVFVPMSVPSFLMLVPGSCARMRGPSMTDPRPPYALPSSCVCFQIVSGLMLPQHCFMNFLPNSSLVPLCFKKGALACTSVFRMPLPASVRGVPPRSHPASGQSPF